MSSRREFMRQGGRASAGALLALQGVGGFGSRWWIDRFEEMAERYRSALLNDVLPFWLRYAPDREFGGYFSALGRDGEILSTDKYMWQVTRQAWTFAMMYNRFEARPEWLEHASLGIEFMRKFGRTDDGGWYFALSREGTPLKPESDFFAACFAALALGEYARATGSEADRTMAREAYDRTLQDIPRPVEPEGNATGLKPLEMRYPMIFLNVATELRPFLSEEEYERTTAECSNQITSLFLDEPKNVLLERVAADGSRMDSPAGRLVCPGHGCEAAWILLEAAQITENKSLIDKSGEILISTFDFGWDASFGGLLTFLDLSGEPATQSIWDRKRLWVHADTLIGLILTYEATGDRRFLDRFEQLDAFVWSHFPDPGRGDWFFDLNRDGVPFSTDKGANWRGCFHLPRALYRCMRTLEALSA